MAAARFLRRSRRGAASGACLCVLVLAACADLGVGAEQAAGAAALTAAPGAGRSAVEAASAISTDLVPEPAAFQATGTARWDGRRTLQGVWVAHPQASGVRRVRIYNEATGAAADGALFTREATLSGPSVLVSSDAATILGMTPGIEAELRIVALSTPGQGGAEALARAPGAAPPSNRAASAAIEAPAARPAEAAVARPAAPRDQASSEPSSKSGERTSSRPTTAPAASISDAAPQAAAEAVPPITSAAPGAASSPVGPAVDLDGPPEGMADASASERSVESAASGARPDTMVEPAPPHAADLHAGRDGATPSAGEAVATAAESVSTAGADPGVASTQPRSSLLQPYVQAGIFSVPENATRLIGRLEAAGLPAVGRRARMGSGPATRVLAGPFATAAQRDSARRRIQAMGLRDAVPVAR